MVHSLLATLALASGGIWSIDPSNTLRWNGEPYAPFGLRIKAIPEEIENAKRLGFEDVLVELPASGSGWTEAFQRLEAAKLRYFITIDSMAPRSPGYIVLPSGYRIPNLNQDRTISFAMPGASSALVALVSQRDSSLLKATRSPVNNGFFRSTVNAEGVSDTLTLIYPRMDEGTLPDYWEGFDAQRDALLKNFKNAKPGSGFRGLFNPLGQVVKFPDASGSFIPDSKLFRTELAALLRRKYNGVMTACRVWQLSAPNFDSFDVMARLVPLWSGSRGIGKLWDPTTDQTYDTDQRRSQAWRDIQEAILLTSSQRTERLFRSLSTVLGVPVFQDYVGATGPYSLPKGAVNGVGVSMHGDNITEFFRLAYPAAGAVMSRLDTGALIVTDFRLTADAEPIKSLDRVVSTLTDMGARGVFLNSPDPNVQKEFLTAVSSFRASTGWTQARSVPLAYPLEAANPAMPIKLPGGRWWLPAANSGERLDLGPDYGAYKLVQRGSASFVIWRNGESKRVRLRVPSNTLLSAAAIDGSAVDLKVTKSGPEITFGSVPIVFTGTESCPIPQDAQDKALAVMGAFIAGKSFAIPDIDAEALNLKQYVDAFAANPGSSHAEIQRQISRVNIAAADYIWIEAERCSQHTWSEVAAEPGASGSSVLRLNARIPSDIAPLNATFKFVPKVAGQQSLWVAARIREADLARFNFEIGEKSFRIESAGVSRYGDNFAWYRVGEFGAERTPQELTISVDAPLGIDAAFDVVVIAPGSFRPDGIRPPLQVPTLPAKGAEAGSRVRP